MKAINYLILLSASILVFASCSKQIAGPTGPTGPAGAQGPAASYTVVFDSVASAGWGGTGPYTFSIPVNAISTTNYNIVEVYYSINQGSNKTYTEMPVANAFATGDYFFFSYTIYQVNIQYDNSGSNAASTAAPYVYFKVVVITQP
ncbi:MAG TPA: hypothetical protein VK809_13415 [Bacteroidia bacterium]|jgi:hypothetical protein|nr:hypothetical protein [Bacteroidia bacterium]